MAMFNHWGVTEDEIALMYANGADDYATVSEIKEDIQASTTKIEDIMDDIEAEIASTMCTDVQRSMTRIEYEDLSQDGAITGTKYYFGIQPVDTSKPIMIWKTGYADGTLSYIIGSMCYDYDYPQKKLSPVCSLDNDQYTTGSDDGGDYIILNNDVEKGQWLFASYYADITSSDYSDESLAMILKLGVAARIGYDLYQDEGGTWAKVEHYREKYDQLLEKIVECDFIPSSLRLLTFWSPIERQANGGVWNMKIGRRS